MLGWKTAKRVYAEVPDHYARVLFWAAVLLGLPAFMIWLALRLTWFWQTFQFFGVACVILGTWAITGLGLGGYRLYRWPEAHVQEPQSKGRLQFVDTNTRSMAGKMRRLGEVVNSPAFVGFQPNSVDASFYEDIENSTHIIWTRQEALKLRREFQYDISKIITARRKKDFDEAAKFLIELEKTISALIKLLLGE